MIYRTKNIALAVKVTCLLTFSYGSEEEARRILSSVQTDNVDFVKTHLDGNSLVSEISADGLMSLLHTLNDYLSCLTVAEEIIGKKSGTDLP